MGVKWSVAMAMGFEGKTGMTLKEAIAHMSKAVYQGLMEDDRVSVYTDPQNHKITVIRRP